MKELIDLYTQHFGTKPSLIEKLPGAGSNRIYYRLKATDNTSVIGVKGTSKEENHAFIYLSGHFEKCNLPVPRILAVNKDEMYYIQTDLGNNSLYDEISGGRLTGGKYNQREIQLLEKTIRTLADFQVRGANSLNWNNCYPLPTFNIDSVLFDLNYFKYCFLKPIGIDFHELKLEANFRLFAKDLVAEDYECFLYRDFQARNVMIDKQGNPYFIDFQGGRKGPFYYDLASFLWQASAKYSFKLRRSLVAAYYYSLKNYIEVPPLRHFVDRLRLFVLFRTLQVLGAYGFRGYFEKKPHFINSIPSAIQNLRDLLNENHNLPYSYLIDILKKMINLPQFNKCDKPNTIETKQNTYNNNKKEQISENKKLVVTIYSFSYKKGIPTDHSGNGGGYVFDCRATNNPGRYEPYKKLTGLDEPVIRFLEDDGEILTFLQNVYNLADQHVKRYIQRGFTHLMFAFGCTGGQHRSVYSAQHLAEHIYKKFGIEIRLTHREQNINEIFKAKNEN